MQHFNTQQAAAYLNAAGLPFTPGTLNTWRHECRGPAYLKLQRRIFYRQPDLDQFIAKAGVFIETADSTLAA